MKEISSHNACWTSYYIANEFVVGIIFASLLNMLDGDAKEHMRWICYGFSLVGIFIGVAGVMKASNSGNGVSLVISLTGLALGIITMIWSIFYDGESP